MFFHDPNAPPLPHVTCPDCGLEYFDDSDWSGDAHGERACIAHLKKSLAEARAELARRDKADAKACRACNHVSCPNSR